MPHNWKTTRVAVLADEHALAARWKYGLNAFTLNITEMLSGAGIPWSRIRNSDEITASRYDLILIAQSSEDADSAAALLAFAEAGGTVVAFGNAPELAERLGAHPEPEAGTGYAHVGGGLPPLRFLGARPWSLAPAAPDRPCALSPRSSGSLALSAPGGAAIGALVQTFPVGAGAVQRWAVDIPATVALLRQGSGPVLNDGVPSPRGDGAVRDGVLKSDDRIALDWELDRLRTETGQAYFAHPYADHWTDVLIGSLLRIAAERGETLPFVDPWPDGVRHVAMISHDSDLNIDESAETTLEILRTYAVRSTWCMLEPGYGAHLYDRIKREGHELALHYNALPKDGGRWDRDEFHRQHEWFRKAAGLPRAVSNKNHYTRREGWGELFAWCEEAGIGADQTYGPSKRGNVGFLFGTCRPYFPISWWNERNRAYDVLEIGFLTQDLNIGAWADDSVIIPFLEQVSSVRGVAHFLFHQVHLHRSRADVEPAFAKLVAEARARGFEFWTCAEINAWERYRRAIRPGGGAGAGAVPAPGSSGSAVPAGAEDPPLANGSARPAVVWYPVPRGAEPQGETSVQHGVLCVKRTVSQGN